ncbi:MAG TPA: DUF945 family protein, partial [Gammaproteobacteria bacterium]|nr:DUF945 family protein [Gammaproteobacteria bacterium]
QPRYAEQLAQTLPAGAGSAPLGGHLPVVLRIAHGPIASLNGVHFGWSKVVARADHAAPQIAALEQQLGVPYLFEFRSRTGFLGTTSFEGEVPKFEVPVEPGSVRFSGAMFAGTTRGRHVKIDGDIGSIELSMPDGSAALHGLRAAVDGDIVAQSVMLGTTGFEIDSVSVMDQRLGSAVFDAGKVKFASKVTLDDPQQRLDIAGTYDIASLKVAGVDVADASVGVAFRNVDLSALQAYQAAAQDVVRTGDASLLQPAVMRLIASRPTFALEPVRVLADGELFEARLELTPNDRVTANSLPLSDPQELLGVVDGNAQIDISRRLAERIAQQVLRMQYGFDPSLAPEQLEQMVTAQSGAMLLMLAGQGIIETSGTGYRAKVELANGQVTLNGRPIPLGLQ